MGSPRRFTTTQQEGIAATLRDGGSGFAQGTRDGVLGPASIVLIDADWITLSRLREIIEQNSDLVVVAACRCAAGAMLAVQKYRPGVVILDVELPERDGVELIRDITATSEAKVIVYTTALHNKGIVSLLRNGAKAVVFKDQPASVVVSRIRKVLAAEPCISRHITTTQDVLGGGSVLTAREGEVAQWAAAGARNKEIAWQLGICEGTVKLHLSNAYRKLKVRNRVGLLLALGKTIQEAITLVNITFDNITIV
jgi:DNA-binding NarL/FixJ family response regulator